MLIRFLFLVLLIIPNFTFSQDQKMFGTFEIGLNEGIIKEKVLITGINNYSSFALHQNLRLDSLYYNNNIIRFSKDENFLNIFIYNIDSSINLKQTDTLKFIISGNFNSVSDSSLIDSYSDSDIINCYSIFRANGSSAWHPIFFKKNTNINSILFDLKSKITAYNITFNCHDCQNISVETEIPSKNPLIYKSTSTPPLILAGNYNWKEFSNKIFINIDTVRQKNIAKEADSIIKFYENLLKIPYTSKTVFAKVESKPNNGSWAFYATPSVVFVNNRRNNNLYFDVLSHEMAHYYFGNIFIPKSNLFYFFTESFTEYFSLKYGLKSGDINEIKSKYSFLKIAKTASYIPFLKTINGFQFRFVNLSKINTQNELHEAQRYYISPLQLLGMEQYIGEAKMIEFTLLVFKNIDDNKDGYKTMIETLREIKIEEKTIKKIEKDFFRHLKIRKYKFAKKMISNH